MKQIITTLTAPSGTGKSHLEEQLVASGFTKLVSHTTRQPRPGEVEGRDYHFTTPDLWHLHNWVEDIQFAGNKYGISTDTLAEVEKLGRPMVVVVEPHGMLAFAEYAANNAGKVIHLPVFLTLSEEVRFSRFLERAVADLRTASSESAYKDKLKNLSTRLSKIAGEERAWTKDALSTKSQYSLVMEYTPESAPLVRHEVLKAVYGALIAAEKESSPGVVQVPA